MKRKLLITVVLILTVVECFAWDGQRQGFILGVGVGPGYTTYKQRLEYGGESQTSDNENSLSLTTPFRIGYAPSDQLMIILHANASWFGMDNANGEHVTILSELDAISIAYFINSSPPYKTYLTGGIGFSSWSAPFEDSESSSGFGLLGGIGYEFNPHWDALFSLCWSNPSYDELGIELTTYPVTISLTVNWTGY
jgi:hypothetical protein